MRLKELDSLRGVAALAVSFGHVLMLVPVGVAGTALTLLAFTPLHGLWDGHRAVLFFFVLSGFVLAVPFFCGTVSPIAFVVKRAVRIYPAYWIAVVVSIGAFWLFGSPHLNLYELANFASLISSHTAQKYDLVVWSLVHEMRLSIILPLLMVPIVRYRSRWVLLGASPLLVAGFYFGSSGIETAYYGWFFILGAVAAKHADRMIAYVRAMTVRRATLWFLVVIMVYGALPTSYATDGQPFPEMEAAVGFSTIGLMVFGLARPGLSRILLSPVLRFVGRLAYSYYLLHLVWIGLVARLLVGTPGIVIAILGIAGSLALAWLAYRWVEVPSIRLGQALYVRISNRIRPLAHVPPASGVEEPARSRHVPEHAIVGLLLSPALVLHLQAPRSSVGTT